MDALDLISEEIGQFKDRLDDATQAFYSFEPWDVAKREQWVYDEAMQDGVDLKSPWIVNNVGVDPHPFQSGLVLSKATHISVCAATQVGKAQPLDAMVQTRSGPVPMGEMEVGDEVLTPTGVATVIQTNDVGIKPVLRVTFDDGSTTECAQDHLWTFMPKKNLSRYRHSHGKRELRPKYGQYETASISDICDRYGYDDVHSSRRWSIPPIDPTVGMDDRLPIDPYVLGALLGDGGITTKRISITCHTSDTQIIDEISSRLGPENSIRKISSGLYAYSVVRSDSVTTKANEITTHLRLMGLMPCRSEHKKIPEPYMTASVRDRVDLLRGLMDTDGTVNKTIVEFYSTSESLANCVQRLVRSLGGKAKIIVKPSHYLKNGHRVECLDCYRVRITIDINPFLLKRKADEFRKTSHRIHKVIRRVERTRTAACKCITISNEDGLYLTDDFIVTHNSFPSLIKGTIMISGEKPIALRYDKGVDTGVQRVVSQENVIRFGRFDAITGEFLDKQHWRKEDSGWNCGNIQGAGIFPEELIMPEGGRWWICTLQKALYNYWWPRFYEKEKMVIPGHMIDRSRNGGYNTTDRTVYANRGCQIVCITYESGFDRVEAETANLLFLDEEPPKQDIHQSAIQHADRLMLIETPYRGITWTRSLIFPDPASCEDDEQRAREQAILDDPEYETYHATQHDCPYKTTKEIHTKKRSMQPWDHGPRVFGVPVDVTGSPYFDRNKLNPWRAKFAKPFSWVKFSTKSKWHGIRSLDYSQRKGLMDTSVETTKEPEDNRLNTWRMYEDVKPDGAYVLTVDPADGGETPEAAADVCAAIMTRTPVGGEQEPVIVATLRSTQEVIPFTNTCLLACRYYNNALLAAETKRGTANGAFWSHAMEYPYWFEMVTMNDKTGLPTAHKGFDPTGKSRGQIYAFISDRLLRYDESADPHLVDGPLMKELEEAVKGKNGRCDHTKRGTLDTVTCFGIMLYVFKLFPEQVKNNIEDEEEDLSDSFVARMTKKDIDASLEMQYLGGESEDTR